MMPVAGLHYHDMEHLAAVRAVVTQMSWTRFSLIGHSMGVKNYFHRQSQKTKDFEPILYRPALLLFMQLRSPSRLSPL